jgi:hypothetical protein
MLTALFLIQAAAAQTPPDIELNLDASVRRVRIEREGEVSIEVTGPDSEVRVDAPEANGRRTLRNVSVRVRADVRIADPRQNRSEAETPRPQ